MAPSDGDRDEDRPIEPTDLRFVGPATAAVIDAAPFEAADVRDRAVTYADLVDAGVNPGVATRLRREYSLVWSFDWVAGAHLANRAGRVAGLDPDQRAWIVESAGTTDGAGSPTNAGPRATTDAGDRENDILDAERAWREASGGSGSPTDEPDACKRCGDSLVTFSLGRRQAVQCEACGFVDVAVRSPGLRR